MKESITKETRIRMVHIRLPGELHKKVRVRAAESEKTIQDWVLEAIESELKRQGERNHLQL